MPAVFVHGVPDTERVWSGVIARLRRNDVVALSLPGFGGEAPIGLDATKEAYRPDVLAEELQRFWKEVSSLPARGG